MIQRQDVESTLLQRCGPAWFLQRRFTVIQLNKTLFKQRRFKVDSKHVYVESMLFQRCVPAGITNSPKINLRIVFALWFRTDRRLIRGLHRLAPVSSLQWLNIFFYLFIYFFFFHNPVW